ncbi:MAG: haloacid dehalogenase [Planctomycetota bacterium]|nr:MAG: haloacid dehalogenase [Planctomycetota bacterium]
MHYTLKPALWRSLLTGAHLRPWRHVRDLSQLALDDLEQVGARGVVLDADNTLVFHGTQNLNPVIVPAFDAMRERFTCVLFSNRSPERHARLTRYAEELGLPIVEQTHKKPEASGFERAAELAGLPVEQLVMVGDRVLTDILGANRAGLRSVLVDPFDGEEPTALTWIRRVERARMGSTG